MAKKLWIEDGENPSILYQENSPGEGWTDKSDDASAWYFKGEAVLDYWFILGKIKAIVLPKCNPNYPTIDFSGWNSLSGIEKWVLSAILSAPYALRVPGIFTEDEDKDNAKALLSKSYGIQNMKLKGRLKIVEDMRTAVFVNYVRTGIMTLDSSKFFGKDTSLMLENFERFATSDFYDWMTNKPGTAYESDGFEQKDYWSQALEDELVAIYTGQ